MRRLSSSKLSGSSPVHWSLNQSFYRQIKASTDSVALYDKQGDSWQLARRPRRSVNHHCTPDALFVLSSDARTTEIKQNQLNRKNWLTETDQVAPVCPQACVCTPSLQKADHQLVAEILSNLSRCSKFFTARESATFSIRPCNIFHHIMLLRYVISSDLSQITMYSNKGSHQTHGGTFVRT